MKFELRYRAVLFDLDGTLIDSSTDLVNSVRHALGRVDPREPPDADTILMEVGKPLEVILKELCYPHDPQSTDLFVKTYRDHFAEHFNEHTTLFPDAREVLDALRLARVRLALVTTKHQVQADFTARELGLANRFEYIHGWKEGRKHKPDPEPLLVAAGELGVSPAEALMVGDSEQDILAAKAAGIDACAVTYGFRPLLMLRTLRPDYLIPRLPDLLPIVGHPADEHEQAAEPD